MDISNYDFCEIAYTWEALSLNHAARRGSELNVSNGVALLRFCFETDYEALSIKIENDESQSDCFAEAEFSIRGVPTPEEAFKALWNAADNRTFVGRNLEFILGEVENFLSLFERPRFTAI